MPPGRQGVDPAIEFDRGLVVPVAKQLTGCRERPRAVLEHELCGQVAELVRGLAGMVAAIMASYFRDEGDQDNVDGATQTPVNQNRR